MSENMMIIMMVIGFCLIILCMLGLVFPSANIFFHLAILKKYKKVQYESEYYRDMLTYSPSEIFYIYNKNFKNKLQNESFKRSKFRKLFLINLIKMDLLGYVSIDYTNKQNFKIIKKDVMILDKEYKFIYDYIFNHITNLNEITLYEIYDYVNSNYNDVNLENWNDFIQEKIVERGFYNGNFITFHGDKIKTYYKITIPIIIIINIVLIILSFRFGIFMTIIFAIFLIAGYSETKNIKVISDEGVYEYRKMVALKRFLKDFSKVEERGPEYSKLLDDYIVYASIFNLLRDDIYLGNVKVEIQDIMEKTTTRRH